MTKFVVVQGPGSTGKTSAIRAAVSELGVDFSQSPVGDLYCVTHIRVGTRNALVGVCSSGDTAEIIRENFNFLKLHELDYAILACRTGETGFSLIQSFRHLVEGEIALVETSKESTSAAIRSAEKAATDRIVEEIRGW